MRGAFPGDPGNAVRPWRTGEQHFGLLSAAPGFGEGDLYSDSFLLPTETIVSPELSVKTF